MPPFCRDPFWDPDLTWNTDSPDLTECFQETALVYLPAAVLFLFLPLQLLYIKRSRDKDVPWTLLNAVRALLTIGLVIVAVVDLAYYVDADKQGNVTGRLCKQKVPGRQTEGGIRYYKGMINTSTLLLLPLQ